MRITVTAGDILDEPADVLICSANGKLEMTGGVNLAAWSRPGGPGIEAELQAHLRSAGSKWVPPGTVVVTGPGPLAFRHILHAVAIDAFYKSGVELVRTTLETAFARAASLGARSAAVTALATGYGRLPMADFATALRMAAAEEHPPLEDLRVVVRHESEVREIMAGLGRTALPT